MKSKAKAVGTLRVIAGKYRSRLLQVPPAAGEGRVRPTGDRVREAIFSIIGEDIREALVLDLFAGSGAYGIESLSRGAKKAIFVELERETAQCIQGNLNTLQITDSGLIVLTDATHFVQRPATYFFNFIFVDPPYPVKLEEDFWQSLRAHMAPDCMVIFRCHKPKDFVLPHNFAELKSRTYSGTYVIFMATTDEKL